MIAILLGPLVLKKVGLEEYAVLGLATYFVNLVTGYSDFGSSTYLLTIYSKGAPDRRKVLGNAVLLKLCLLAISFGVFSFFLYRYPRTDDLYSLLGIFMLGLLLPSVYMEWYFIARRNYFRLFLSRSLLMAVQTILLLAWFQSSFKSPRFIPFISLVSGVAGSVYLLWLLGARRIMEGMAALGSVSFHGLRSIFSRLAPMAASLLLTLYLLAYALPWYSLTCPDKKLVGAFSIAYRLILGMSSLAAPLVIYSIPQNAASNRSPSFSKTLGFSMLAAACFWALGVPVLWFYFHLSKVDPGLFRHSLRAFSIMMAGLFFLCLRTPYVGQRLIHAQYRAYFLILLASCAPVMAISWIGGKRLPYEWVPWLACLPDLLTTIGFVGYDPIRQWFKNLRNAG